VGLLAVIILALGSTVMRGFGQSPLYTWEVNGVASGLTTLNASTAAANISGGQLSLTGLTASGAGSTFGGSNWNLTNSFNEADDYFSFSVTPDSGFQVTYNELKFSQGVSSTAPNTSRWGYKIGAGAFTLQDTFASSNSTDSLWNFTDFTTSGVVEFRFWTYGATSVAGGSPSTSGASRIRNAGVDLALYGSVGVAPAPGGFTT
jgi:hypothetical protein